MPLLCLVPPSTIKACKHCLQIFLYLGEMVWRGPAVVPPPQRKFGADIAQHQGRWIDVGGRWEGRAGPTPPQTKLHVCHCQLLKEMAQAAVDKG